MENPAGPAVAIRHIGRQGRRHRRGQAVAGLVGLTEGGVVQMQGADDLTLDQRLIGLAGDVAGRLPRQGRAVVRIAGEHAGIAHPPWPLLLQIDLQGANAARLVFEELAENPVLEAGGVVHQIAHPHGLVDGLAEHAEQAVPVAHRQLFGQVEVDRGVQPHGVGLDLLHHRDPGEGLGDGGDAKQGLVGIDGGRRIELGKAVALLQHHLAVLHDGDGDPGDVVGAHRLTHDAVDIGLQFGGRDRLAAAQARAADRGLHGRNRRRRRGRDRQVPRRGDGPRPAQVSGDKDRGHEGGQGRLDQSSHQTALPKGGPLLGRPAAPGKRPAPARAR